MKLFNWIFVLSLSFFVSCGKDNKNQKENQADRVLEDYVNEWKNAEPIDPNTIEGGATSVQIKGGEKLPVEQLKCNINNYEDYIYDFEKVDKLILETGAGCYLLGVDFTGHDLEDAVFTNANLKGAIFTNANLTNTKFIKANLTNAVLTDTNYMKAYFRGAILTGATYNEYDSITAWIRFFSGQGIRGPEDKGMIFVKK
ncbi:MAG: pentapeptide repeat-containing protein [Bdellovibrionaceae bacterium]|nr:pentapeptide repeat-containing protein [Pseudobdellovibrionaceae bacterium]